jgi:hypothetical protein
MALRLWCVATLLLPGVPSVAGDPVASGPQVRERPGPYSFLVASGPERGQQTCYVCETAEKPGVIVFARSVSDPLGRLMAACDESIARRPKDSMRAWLTVLGEKTIGLDELGTWAKKQGLKSVPIGVFDDPAGPPSYKLSRDADVTVLLFINRKVIFNATYRTGDLNDSAVKRIGEEVARFGAKK